MRGRCIDRIYSALSDAEQLATQRIFLKLVDIGTDTKSGTDWKPVRRRANRSEFSEPLEQTVLTQLVNQNLLVSNRVKESQDSTIEIAHEVLLTSWKTLNTWITENRQAIALRNRLNDDVIQWQKTQSSEDLWSGSRLEQALELRLNETFNQVLGGFSPTTNQFLDESRDKRDHLEKEKLRRTQLTAIAAVIVAALLGVFWLRAERLRQETKLRQDIATARNLLITQPTQGLVSAIQAVGASYSNFTDLLGAAESSLYSALEASREVNILRGHDGAVTSVAISKNNLIASAGIDGKICLWKKTADNSLGCQKLQDHSGAVLTITFSPDGKNLVSGGEDGQILVWNLENYAASPILQTPNSPIRALVFHPQHNNTLYSGGDDGTVREFNINPSQDSADVRVIGNRPGAVTAIAVNPEGKTLVVGGEGHSLRLWNLERLDIEPQILSVVGRNEPELADMRQVVGQVTSIVFAKDTSNHQLIASTALGNEPHRDTIHILSIDQSNDYTQPVSIQAHEFNSYALAFNPENNQIISAGDDGTIRFFQFSYRFNKWNELDYPLLGHSGGRINEGKTDLLNRYGGLEQPNINTLALSDNYNTIVSGGNDGTVIIWDIEPFTGIRKSKVIDDIKGYELKTVKVNIYESIDDPIRRFNPSDLNTGWLEITQERAYLILRKVADTSAEPKFNQKLYPEYFFSDDAQYIATVDKNNNIQVLDKQGNALGSDFAIGNGINTIALSFDFLPSFTR